MQILDELLELVQLSDKRQTRIRAHLLIPRKSFIWRQVRAYYSDVVWAIVSNIRGKTRLCFHGLIPAARIESLNNLKDF